MGVSPGRVPERSHRAHLKLTVRAERGCPQPQRVRVRWRLQNIQAFMALVSAAAGDSRAPITRKANDAYQMRSVPPRKAKMGCGLPSRGIDLIKGEGMNSAKAAGEQKEMERLE